ncbi:MULTISPECIES: DUF3830 family protein [Streptomyces]|uniref:DUF3830 family protein n=1 Tax=Streptomyces stelliscabiei TaxID=146820 RepID=A0A8I0P3J3_9ACTN|nr:MULTISPECIES: DUF3830 family protein [Streptomyces]KND40995.1 hypothetical protein IQ64_31565 [Streptomyces stelliscabiei]MBE1597565.1 hypothetical protein [Streptomyces stelliscabiei]MDX2522179.1 DUF3830 family protein [Streptomyces stelliscabiei]MDX2549787.1 DUF3830 family protein [Streptomyces stelliscabiei]MDX2610792.1 DUF3830 family protein [Streptomyces stelliscabiei]
MAEPAERHIEIALDRRGVRCTALLLDDRAPITCAAVWDALPLSGDVYHAKYARNEIYALFPPFADREPPLENPTVTPIPGDLCYFSFAGTELATGAYGYDRDVRPDATLVDLALFYERNNLLLNGDVGWVPGIVWGQVTEGLREMAQACNDLWRSGALGETLTFRRA